MRQKILTAVLALSLIATAVVWFVFLREPSAPTASPAVAEQESSPEIAQLRQLKNFRLDTAIFSSRLFQVLVDFLPPASGATATPGRTNPFEPF